MESEAELDTWSRGLNGLSYSQLEVKLLVLLVLYSILCKRSWWQPLCMVAST